MVKIKSKICLFDYEKKTISKAKYIKPYIQTTVSHDFSDKLKSTKQAL